MRPRVVLVGPPGAGKTTVGRLLAQRLGASFRDVDHDIVERAGKPINEIFIDDGEEHFRALERDAVAEALRTHDGVLSLGGGAVLSEQTRNLLKEHTVALLDVGVAVAEADAEPVSCQAADRRLAGTGRTHEDEHGRGHRIARPLR